MANSDFDMKNKVKEIRTLLEKFRLEELVVARQSIGHNQITSQVTKRQQAAELYRHLKSLHAADIAYLIELMTVEERAWIWLSLPDKSGANVLLELSEPVLASTFKDLPKERIFALLAPMDHDDLNTLKEFLPGWIWDNVLARMDQTKRDDTLEKASFPDDSVGFAMSLEWISVAETSSLAEVQNSLQKQKLLPDSTDKLFVVDKRGRLIGALSLQAILVNNPEQIVRDVMHTKIVTFNPQNSMTDAASAFERYDLVSAPVVNDRGKPIGRLTFDIAMDYVRTQLTEDTLNMAGVVQTEDLFASVWTRARNRWLWLSINLMTAFFVSRIVGNFEYSISQIAALASLMPIVASMAGNTGNQTTALMIRRLSMGNIDSTNVKQLFLSELSVALLNGTVWGSLVGLFTYAIYSSLLLSLVVTLAMLVTIFIAAFVGVGTPYLLQRVGRDPAMGSSVILTGLTDATGFFVFLLLATMILL